MSEAQDISKLMTDNFRMERLIRQYEEIIYKQPTLRDQFAMSALQGLLASSQVKIDTGITKGAYEVADAMLEARKKD